MNDLAGMDASIQGVPASKKGDVLQEARRVLLVEAQALQSIAETLGHDFESAVEIFASIEGRVVVTGMGKSGHIARKIAATFASTGMPAFFVHPAEASHGDLGMMVRGDALLAISNSGETRELADILFYARRIGVPVVAMTSSAGSSLGRAAQAVLLLPAKEEACPLNIAPMASTTVSLALGDALAAALMLSRSFDLKDFGRFHPGGKLGSILLTAADIMHRDEEVPIVSSGAEMRAAIMVMTEKGFGCVGVLDQWRNLIGIMTDGDLRRAMPRMNLSDPIDRHMTTSPRHIEPTMLIAEVARTMEVRGIPSIFVVNERGTPFGIIHVRDLLRSRHI